MTSKVISPGTGRLFYGWFALAGCMLVIFVVSGAFVYSYGVLLPVLVREFGWSRASLGAGLSLGVLSFGLPSPLIGLMVTRFGPRLNIVVGNAVAALGLAGMFLVQEVWHIYLLYVLIGFSGGVGGYIAGTTVINNWFVKKRSLALGMFVGFGSMGGFVFPPMTTALISAMGWRMSWLVLGAIVFVVAVLIGGLLLIRNKPEDMGQLPDGVTAESSVEIGAREYPSVTGAGQGEWRMKEVLQMPIVWLIGAFAAANTFITGTMTAHQVAYIQDSGFSPMTAAMTLSIIYVSSIVGSLGFGTLALRYNLRYLAIICFVVELVALGILLTTKELTFIYVYAALLGIGSGALLAAMPTFVGTYYGRDHYAQVLGVTFPLQIIGMSIAATIAGAIYDATGTYLPAFAVLAAVSLTGLICVSMARQPKLSQPDR